MRKTTKGALASAAAGVLLLGGVGSLAYWTADGDAEGGSITAGTLTLTDGTCAAWTYGPTPAAGLGDPVLKFVPGDKVTTTCTFEIGATGDNLSASIETTPTTVTMPAPAGADSFQANVATAYAIDGTAVTTPVTRKVTSDDEGKDLTATFNVTIPYGDADTINTNDTQGITAVLGKLTVKLTQDNPNTP